MKRDRSATQWFGDVRSLLHGAAHGHGTWAALCELMWQARREPWFSSREEYVLEHLASWPELVRRAPAEWPLAMVDGELLPNTALWQCVRVLDLDGEVLEEGMRYDAEEMHEVLLSPGALGSMRALALRHMELDDEMIKGVLDHASPGSLISLDLRGNTFSEEAVRSVALGASTSRLRTLDLRANYWGGYEEAITHLVNAPCAGSLQRLSLECDLTRHDLLRVLESYKLGKKLEHLGLTNSLFSSAYDGHEVQEAGLAALSDAEMRLGALRVLDLDSNQLDDERFTELLEIPWLTRLHALNLGWNELTDDSVARLSRAMRGGRFALEELSLRGCEIGERGARELLLDRSFERLRRLDVSSTSGVSESEAFSDRPPRLLGFVPSARFWVDLLSRAEPPAWQALNLSDLSLDLQPADIDEMARGGGFQALESLELANVSIDADTILALWQHGRAGGSGFGRLKSLNLNRNLELGEQLRALLGQTLPQELKHLSMRECEIREEDVLWMCEQSEKGCWAWSGLEVLDLGGHYFPAQVHEALSGLIIRERCDVRIDPWRMFLSPEDE